MGYQAGEGAGAQVLDVGLGQGLDRSQRLVGQQGAGHAGVQKERRGGAVLWYLLLGIVEGAEAGQGHDRDDQQKPLLDYPPVVQ